MRITKMSKIFAMVLAALTIASCTNTEEIGGSNNDTAGEEINAPTYATFKFNIGGASSRGITDPDGAGELPINNVIGRIQLLIFNAATQALEFNELIPTKATSKTVLLTAGKKKIFFVANSDHLTEYNTAIAPTTFKVGAGKTLTDFYALNFNGEFDFSRLYSVAGISMGNMHGLPMSNTNEVTYTLVGGVNEADSSSGTETTPGTSATNNFKMQLYFMVAKARLALKTGEVLSAGDDTKPAISNVKYSIRNLARITNYIQNVPTAGNPQSFYYTSTFANQAAFDAEFNYAPRISVDATETAGGYLYVPENNHLMLLRGQSSYYAIKATFEPIVISAVTYDMTTRVKYTTKKLAVADPTNKSYIYTTKDIEGIPAGSYFLTVALLEEAAWISKYRSPFDESKNREDAKTLVKDPTSTAPTVDGDYMSFTGGNSYYRIDLGIGSGAETQYGVLRSNSYDATINKITGPGVPSEKDLIVDPTNPVSAKTHIKANVEAAQWTPLTQSADL